MEANQNTQTAGDELAFSLFLAAMSRPESDRAEYVRAACAGDMKLEGEVARRIEWELRMGGFLLKPAAGREAWLAPFQPGKTVMKRFQILRVAGEGGMATVYEAFDEKLRQRIALKCPRYEFRKRVSPEAVKALSVTHENVCRVFELHSVDTDAGEADFLTMEFIDGETLAKRLENASPRWLENADGELVARQICFGLKAIHSSGVIHRDLKPNNVMLARGHGKAPRAVIMDFGIAQGGDIFSSHMRGTPSYLAPEIWRGKPASVRSDLYALGVLLYEMASAKKPYPDEMNWRDRLGTPPSPPEVSEPLRSAICRCLLVDPAERFEDVSQVEKALWPEFARRDWMKATLAVSLLGSAGYGAWKQWFPASPVRLAVLGSGLEGEGAELFQGFLHDLSFRLKTSSRSKAGLVVFTHAQAVAEGVSDAPAARRVFGANHVLGLSRNDGKIKAELWMIGKQSPLGSWSQPVVDANLAGALFALEGEVARGVTAALGLTGEAPRLHLPQAAYADYLTGLQVVRADAEQPERAAPYFERVITAAPASPLGYAGQAEAYLGAVYSKGNQNFHSKAATMLAKAEQIEPESAHVQLMQGRLNAFEGQNERALAHFRRAAELSPNEAQAFTGMGYAYTYLGRYPEAESAFRESTKIQPGYYRPFVDAGLFHYETGDYAGAKRLWLEAVRLNPAHTRAKLNLGYVAAYEGKLIEAETAARESLALRKNLPAYELLGDVQAARGMYGVALDAYEAGRKAGPPSYEIFAPLGREYIRAGRNAEAQIAWEEGLGGATTGLAINPRDPARLAWCAYFHAKLGEAEAARARASEAMAVTATPVVRVRLRLILTFDALGDVGAALSLLDGAGSVLLGNLLRGGEISNALRRAPQFSGSISTRKEP